MNASSGAAFEEMIREYRDDIEKLQRRRDKLGWEIGVARERLAALDDEIDELHEALAMMCKEAER